MPVNLHFNSRTPHLLTSAEKRSAMLTSAITTGSDISGRCKHIQPGKKGGKPGGDNTN